MTCLAHGMAEASQTYLYLGGPSDFACSCSRTFAVSRGNVAICKQATRSVGRKLESPPVDARQRFVLLTSAVQAAIAELTNVAHTGKGLIAGEFAGGDMLLSEPINQCACRHSGVAVLAGSKPCMSRGRTRIPRPRLSERTVHPTPHRVEPSCTALTFASLMVDRSHLIIALHSFRLMAYAVDRAMFW